jgi:hypothetical protein
MTFAGYPDIAAVGKIAGRAEQKRGFVDRQQRYGRQERLEFQPKFSLTLTPSLEK